MKQYTALDRKGRGLIAVIAASSNEARALITKELHKDASREAYLLRWERGGSMITTVKDVEKIKTRWGQELTEHQIKAWKTIDKIILEGELLAYGTKQGYCPFADLWKSHFKVDK